MIPLKGTVSMLLAFVTQKKGIVTAVGTLLCALGIGFVMQSSDTAQHRYGVSEGTNTDVPMVKGADAGNALLDVQSITLTSADFNNTIAVPAPDMKVVKASAPQSMPPVPDVPEAEVTGSCAVSAFAEPIAAAMVKLSMEAPCLPNERVTIHHNGMIFTETTTFNGTLDLTVPALAKDAVFVLAFSNGDGAVAQTLVEDLGEYDRSVLQWKGNAGFQIHAREFGAGYGDAGHLWESSPGAIADAVTGNGGVMARYGDVNAADPLLAEVYSFPVDANGRSGTVAMSVEAEITAANCGLEIEAQSLELLGDESIKTQNLTLDVPECDAIGGFLVLNNLLADLKIAAK
jgi:hypothetical protein